MEEIWKPIKGFEGLYEISSRGRLKSYKKTPKGQILKLHNKKGDYFKVSLQGKGKHNRSVSVHRLVAEHFLPNPHNLPQVNHIDGNKQNNMADNLEWCTPTQNVRHSLKMHPNQLTGMIMFNKYGKTKPIVQLSKSGDVIQRFSSGAEASRLTGVCGRNILQVANHTEFKKGHPRKTAGGYVWRYESEVIKK